MPLIYGSYLAGALLTCLVPIGLLIAFVSFFYSQFRRVPENSTPASSPAAPTTPTVISTAAPASPPEVTPGQPSTDA